MRKYILLVFCLGVLFMNSCIVPKKVVYLKDMQLDSTYLALNAPPIRLQKNDRVSITVTAKNAELAAPFNMEVGSYSVTNTGQLSKVGGSVNNSFLVSDEGYIEYPILGSLQVEGLTLDGIRDLIRERLVSSNLINDPIIKVELLNLKITILGELGFQILSVPDTRMTLLEAIAQAGGLTPNATTDEVAVIREENGGRRMYYNDIQSIDIFNSPTFYLQQNDIIYVKPKTAVETPREQMTWRYFTLFTGLLAIGMSTYAIFFNN